MRRVVKLIKILQRQFYWHGLRLGVAAGIEHEKLLKNYDCKTILDVGANRGQFALVASYLHTEAKIISFEPLSRPAEIFQSVFANDHNVCLHQVAIGTESRTADINVSAADDSSSLLPITELQNTLFPGTAHKFNETIKVASLNEYVSPEDIHEPALLKLDVQGYELEALKGCEDLLHQFQYVYVECSFVELYTGQALASEVIAWLDARGFLLSGVYNLAYDKTGRAIQGDFFFSRLKGNTD